jgi:hypothetical protein
MDQEAIGSIQFHSLLIFLDLLMEYFKVKLKNSDDKALPVQTIQNRKCIR